MVVLMLRLSVAFRPLPSLRYRSSVAVQRVFASTASDAASTAVTTTQYPFAEVEPKWQAYWEEHQTFLTPERSPDKGKKYVLDMFPYPSGAGLHVGHPEGYTGKDQVLREHGISRGDQCVSLFWILITNSLSNQPTIHQQHYSIRCYGPLLAYEGF